MKVIYSCYWGSYLAVVAASLHLGYIDIKKYDGNKIMVLPMFNRIKNYELGKLFFVGTDDAGMDVYIIGSKKSGCILEKTFNGIAEIYGLRKELVVFIDLNVFYNIFLYTGTLLIKRLNLHQIGIKLVVKGIEKNYKKLNKVVQNVKNNPICTKFKTRDGLMKIFYYCYGSAHSSVVAASIHLGLLPIDRIPVSNEFKRLPHYDKTESFEIGIPFFMGKDECNSDVYILGMASQRDLIKRAMLSFLTHLGIDTQDLLLIDTLENVNLITKIGGFTSRRLGFVGIGRPLTIIGIKQKYQDFIKLVDDVKRKEQEMMDST